MAVYRSKADAWLEIVLVAAIGISLYGSVEVISAGLRGGWWTLILTVGLGTLVPVWVRLEKGGGPTN